MKEMDITRAKILGVLVQDARQHAGRSTADCAHVLGLSVNEMEQVERGEKSLSLPHLEALAIYLNVPMAHFWGTQTLEQRARPDLAQFVSLRDRMIGALLRQARLEANCSPADLAAVIDVDEAHIEKYETGQASVPFLELQQLAQHLNQTIDYFIDDRHGPLAHHENSQKIRQRFGELPVELQEFITNPRNIGYLETARRLSEMDVDRLRRIAEGLLDITY